MFAIVASDQLIKSCYKKWLMIIYLDMNRINNWKLFRCVISIYEFWHITVPNQCFKSDQRLKHDSCQLVNGFCEFNSWILESVFLLCSTYIFFTEVFCVCFGGVFLIYLFLWIYFCFLVFFRVLFFYMYMVNNIFCSLCTWCYILSLSKHHFSFNVSLFF